jgi:hypothetical protein
VGRLTPTQQDAHRRMLDYYDKTHRQILTTNIGRLIGLKEMVPGRDAATTEALMKHILKEDLTRREDLLNDNVRATRGRRDDQVARAGRFRNDAQIRQPGVQEGTAVAPGIRRGDWVVAGHKLDHIAERFGGVKIGDRGAACSSSLEDAARGYYRR